MIYIVFIYGERGKKNMKIRIKVNNKANTAEKGYYTIKFDLDKKQDEFEIRHHNYKCPVKEEHCVYNNGIEHNKPGINGERYVEFYIKSDSRESAVMEASDKYKKFVAVWNLMNSIEAAGRALGGRSKNEVDEENFKIQLEWHNKVFQ